MAETDKKPLNKPMRSDAKNKKRKVYVKDGDKVKTIHYGHTDYRHNYSAKANKAFRDRHDCANAKDKTSARYWACKDLWPAGGGKKGSGKAKYDLYGGK